MHTLVVQFVLARTDPGKSSCQTLKAGSGLLGQGILESSEPGSQPRRGGTGPGWAYIFDP